MPNSPLPRGLQVGNWFADDVPTITKSIVITHGKTEDDLDAADAANRLGDLALDLGHRGRVSYDGHTLTVAQSFQFGWSTIAEAFASSRWVAVEVHDQSGMVRFVFSAQADPQLIMESNNTEAMSPGEIVVGLRWFSTELVRIVEKKGDQ